MEKDKMNETKDENRDENGVSMAGQCKQDSPGKKKFFKRKFSDTWLAFYLISVAVILLGQILGQLLYGVVTGVLAVFLPSIWESDVWYTFGMYICFIGIWVVAFFYMGLTKKNRPILKTLWTNAKGNTIGKLLLGIVIGFGLNGVCVLAAWLHRDITLSFAAFEPLALIAIFAAVFVQSSAEELVCRGFMYQRFLKSYGKPSIAIVGNALFFGVLHLSNEGVTFLSLVNIFLFGILFSFIVYYMDSIWCAFAVHTAWNFMQNILFGLPNSGIVVPYSMFKLEAGTAANSFAYHVGFGIEGTLLANAVLLAAGIAMYFWGKRVKKNDSSQSVCTAATERKNFNTVE
jgi:membrane protease YdiL (CAAX protease family)